MYRIVIIKNYKVYLSLFLVIFIFIYLAWKYVGYIDREKELKQLQTYQTESSLMQTKVSNLILSKQKATMAMALSVLSDRELAKNIVDKKIDENYFKDLIEQYKEYTYYQNIWVHIIDKDFVSVYKSWSPEMGDNIRHLRKDLVVMSINKKPKYFISVGKYEFSIKASVPVIQDDKVVGYLELVSHFNSISKEMEKFNIDSAVILNKEYKAQLKFPFTNTFINDYYVANMNINSELKEYLQNREIEKYFTSGYVVKDNYLITSHELKSPSEETLGYYLMFKKLDDIATPNIDSFILKWTFLGVLLLMSLAGIVNITLFYFNAKQKQYYKRIMDSSTNIVVINHNDTILDVNEAFFRYFDKYNSLDEFQKDHKCICELFEKDDGYLQKDMYGENWIEYLIKNPDKKYKAKIKYADKIYYFVVTTSIIFKEKSYYSAVFSDITNEEIYRHELEHLSTTDSLTSIRNRHYFSQRVEDEIHRSQRYKTPFSLVMFDIDHFKKVNDDNGHDAGDRVLVEYTKLISTTLRDSDTFCRVGGEEFIVMLPHTIIENAIQIAEKLRVVVEIHEDRIPITISLGVVEYKLDESLNHFLKRVDVALYKAKDDGRNRVVAG